MNIRIISISEDQTYYKRIIYIQIKNKVKKEERNKKEKTQKRKKRKRKNSKAWHACSMRSAASPNYNNLCVAQPAQTTCKRTASWAIRNLLGRFSMIVVHLVASFQAMDDDFATRATYSRSGEGRSVEIERATFFLLITIAALFRNPWLSTIASQIVGYKTRD